MLSPLVAVVLLLGAVGTGSAREETAGEPVGRLVIALDRPIKAIEPARASLWRAGKAVSGQAISQAVACQVSEPELRTVTCALPAGRWDARIEVPGMVPLYFWDLEIAPDAAVEILEPSTLVAGASITGWVEAAARDVDLARSTVTLGPELATDPNGRQVRHRQDRRGWTVKPDRRGFFQFRGVQAGAYVVEAALDGFTPARASGIRVGAVAEVRLDAPLTLHPPATLDVYLDPQQTPTGGRWALTLLRSDPRDPTRVEMLTRQDASEQGVWTVPVPPSGAFEILLQDELGSQWHVHELALDGEGAEVFIDLPLVEFEGHIRAGDVPIEAELWFGQRNRQTSIKVQSDEEGNFHGWLPREGSWPLDLELPPGDEIRTLDPVEVERRPGRRVARVDIELPDTVLEGRVVNARGEPVAGARITVLRPKNAETVTLVRDALAAADDEGRFALFGLRPGEIRMRAISERGASSWRLVTIAEGDLSPPQTLRIEEQVEIRGLVTVRGQPVPGAGVSLMPRWPDGRMESFYQDRTGADGVFAIEIPARAAAADIMIAPPGLPLELARFSMASMTAGDLIIDLPPAGGVLVIEVEPGTPFLDRFQLVRGGGAIPVHSVLSFGRFPTLGDGTLRFEQMGAGRWSLCPTEMPSDECHEGDLPPGGTLVLRATKRQGPSVAALRD